jgi:hypothetical protein
MITYWLIGRKMSDSLDWYLLVGDGGDGGDGEDGGDWGNGEAFLESSSLSPLPIFKIDPHEREHTTNNENISSLLTRNP